MTSTITRTAAGERVELPCRSLWRLVALASLAAALALAGPVFALKFMPAGDSITEGQGSTNGLGFRHLLYTSLNGIGSFDFVGPSGTAPDEGYFFDGVRIDDYRAGGAHDIGPSITSYQPATVAIHLGTNDLNSTPGPYGPWSNNHSTPNANASGDLAALVNYALGFPSVDRVVLSRIIPIAGREDDIATFNREVVRMVLDYRNGAVTGFPVPVYLADHYLRFSSSPDLASGWMAPDGMHPNDAGYEEMGQTYFETVNQALNDVTPPNPATDLAVGTRNGRSLYVLWTNTGDDGDSGQPAYVDLRYSTSTITPSNFKNQKQAGDYELIGGPGEVSGIRVWGLSHTTDYFFAVKFMDDAGNLSAMSNVADDWTAGVDYMWLDTFSRLMADPGPEWRTSVFQVINDELDNTSAGYAAAIYTTVVNPTMTAFNYGVSAPPSGIDRVGLLCRAESTDPATVDGYMVIGNSGSGPILLKEVIDGVPGQTIDSASPTQPAFGPGDQLKVFLTSNGSGHHFQVLRNNVNDVVLDDPQKLHGNGAYWIGVVSNGSYANAVDEFEAKSALTNEPPAPFDLVEPADLTPASLLNPYFDWQTAYDPNGDTVDYDLFVSTDPGFPAGQTTEIDDIVATSHASGVPLGSNATYYWKVRAQDPAGASTFSDTWTFTTGNYQQVRDDFERAALGPDWVADPTYSIVNGEIDCTAPGSGDLAIYSAAPNPVSVEWTWSETATSAGIGAGGVLIGMDAASTAASGYYLFRATTGQRKWSVWQVVNGEPTGSLGIDRSGATPVPGPGDRVRVVFYKTPTAHIFDCYINDVFDARMIDPGRVQGTGPTTYAGLLLSMNEANNVEELVVMGEDLNLPPGSFSLVGPPHQTIIYTPSPEMSWTPAVDPNPGDIVSYVVTYDTDPSFGTPESLPPTTATTTIMSSQLEAGQTYYWRVVAEDGGGAQVTSNQTWVFITSPAQTIRDDFNRANLGGNWGGDTAVMRIAGNELANTSASGTFDLAIYNATANPEAVQFTWSPTANSNGIVRGGMALMMSAATGTASGYWITIDPFTNRSKLEEIRNGAIGFPLTASDGQTATAGPSDIVRVDLSSDGNGHHFDVYVNGVYHSTVSDPAKRQGNGATLYAGVGLRGQQANNVDDFELTARAGAAPSPFSLLAPANADTGVAYRPTFTWQAAGPAGMAYIVYVGTDSTFAAADSLVLLTDTSRLWPTDLTYDTQYYWRVRATNGETSVLSSPGWYRFRTTVVAAVELAGFAARGESGRVILSWTTSAETDHLGFHVWRAADEDGPYARLTEEPLAGESPYSYEDPTAAPGVTYHYRLEAVSRSGSSQFFGPVAAAALAAPLRLALHQNVPNPFNPSTAIGFDLPARDEVRLAVFDLAGRLVRELHDGVLEAGHHSIAWDGRGRDGQPAGSGIYFARLAVGDWSATRKLLLVK